MASTCLICDGGPGNECACTCPNGPTYEIRSPKPPPMDPTSSRLRGEEFIRDWNAMIGKVSEFSNKWNLPKPEMIFHRDVHRTMNLVAGTRILGTVIYMGVKVRFGRFEQMTVLREG